MTNNTHVESLWKEADVLFNFADCCIIGRRCYSEIMNLVSSISNGLKPSTMSTLAYPYFTDR